MNTTRATSTSAATRQYDDFAQGHKDGLSFSAEEE